MSLKLIKPCKEYFESYKEAFQEELKHPGVEMIFSSSPTYIEDCKNHELGINLPEGYVPDTKLWLVDENHFIGEVGIRHKLTPFLLNYAGNIGYQIRFNERGKGYGKTMLKMALDYSKNVLGLRKVLITCDVNNIASEKVIIANGGIFAGIQKNQILDRDVETKRYWINLDANIIETERLYLREFTPDDWNNIKNIISDPITMKYYQKPYDDNGVDRWLNWSLQNYSRFGFGWWAIILKENGKFIGDCGVTFQNIDNELLPEIGYHVDKDFHRKGYGFEAANAVKNYMFKNYSYEKLYSYTTSLNIPSQKLAMKNGMKKVKEYSDGDEILYVYSISFNEWKNN